MRGVDYLKLQALDLVLEITRRCNQRCEHCLRGPAQRKDMSSEIVEALFRTEFATSTLTFTGGEPSLNSELIYEIAYCLRDSSSTASYFWVKTNAKVFKPQFVAALCELQSFVEEEDLCVLTVSNDFYHLDNSYVREKYKELELPFYQDSEQKEDYRNLINEGLAQTNGIGTRDLTKSKIITDYYYYDKEDILDIDEIVYINAIGDVVLNCDYSYHTQKQEKIGNILEEDLLSILIRSLDPENEDYEDLISNFAQNCQNEKMSIF